MYMRHRHSITENPGQMIGLIVASATVGAITAMLVTPRSGDQVRSGLKRRASSAKDSFQNKAETINKTVDDVKDGAKDTAQSSAANVTNSTKTTATNAKDDASEAAAKAKAAASKPNKPSQ